MFGKHGVEAFRKVEHKICTGGVKGKTQFLVRGIRLGNKEVIAYCAADERVALRHNHHMCSRASV